MDVDTIEPGVDFVRTIEEAVAACDVLIAVIGTRWLVSSDQTRSRLDNPEDFVRLEIAAALKRDIRVIPVLVEGASIPTSSDLPDDLKPLARRNGVEVSHTRFNTDADLLVGAIERALHQAKVKHEAAQQARTASASTEKTETPHNLSKETEAEQGIRRRFEGKQPSIKKRALSVEQKQTNGHNSQRHLLTRPFFIVALVALIAAMSVIVIANKDKLVPPVNLSGMWICDDGATYTIRQEGRKISWNGDNPPAFRNLFDGLITDQGYVEGAWHDLPGYGAFSHGTLTLKIDNPHRLFRVSQTGNFSGSIWTKN